MSDLTNPMIGDAFPPNVDSPRLSLLPEVLMRALAHQGEIVRQLTLQASGHYEEIANLRFELLEVKRRLATLEKARPDGRRRGL